MSLHPSDNLYANTCLHPGTLQVIGRHFSHSHSKTRKLYSSALECGMRGRVCVCGRGGGGGGGGGGGKGGRINSAHIDVCGTWLHSSSQHPGVDTSAVAWSRCWGDNFAKALVFAASYSPAGTCCVRYLHRRQVIYIKRIPLRALQSLG